MAFIRKSSPTLDGVHINRPLTQISIAYQQKDSAFIAETVFPKVPVDHRTDIYWTYPKEYFFRIQAKKRAPGSVSAGGTFKISTGTYTCDVWAFHGLISDQVRENEDEGLNLDMVITQQISKQFLLVKENEFSQLAFTASNWSTSLAGAAAGSQTSSTFVNWDDYKTNPTGYTSNPVVDIQDLSADMLEKTGYEPNMLVLSVKAFNALRMHPIIRDIFKYTTDKLITPDALAPIFFTNNDKPGRVLLSKAVVSTSQEGLDSTSAYQFMNNNSGFLCYTTDTPTLLEATAAYEFEWKYVSGGEGGTVIKSWYDEDTASTKIEGQCAFCFEVIAADLGATLTNILAAA